LPRGITSAAVVSIAAGTIALSAAGCGASDSQKAANAYTAAQKASQQTLKAIRTTGGQDAAVESAAVLIKNEGSILTYCVAKVKFDYHRGPAPGSALADAEQKAISNVESIAAENLTITVAGQSLKAFLTQEAKDLRIGSCDIDGSETVQAVAQGLS
jgi:hypothetical protein